MASEGRSGGGGDRLMEAFIVSAATEVGDKMTPIMMFCYAPVDAHLMQYKPVPDFSFPDPQQLRCSPKSSVTSTSDRETFVFTLTDKDSNRLYGFCRRYIASAGTEVACILSRHCWYETIHVVLDAVEETAKGSTGAYGVAALIKAVTSAGLPQPGQLLHVPVKGIHPRLHALSVERPINTSRCSYDRRLCVLFRSLVVSKIVMLFFLMLTERRVILMSAHPSVLSDCAHALNSLLYPFQWEHIYVPILVPKMIDYVCAPMPFLIGMHISMLPQLKAQPMEEVVMVDLDRGRLRYNEKDIQHLPDEHFDAMVNALQASLEGKTGHDSQDWAALANVFLDFFLAVFSNYRRFIKTGGPDRAAARGGFGERASSATFANEEFVRSHRKNITKFLREFERSQMYEVFFYQRSSADFRGSATQRGDPFELAVSAIHGPDLGGRALSPEAEAGAEGGGGVQSNSWHEGDASRTKEEAGEKGGAGGSKSKSMMRGFLSSMTEMASSAAESMALKNESRAYKPTYLKDERGYIKSTHMLQRIYAEVGMPGFSGLHRSLVGSGNGSAPVVLDPCAWREEWFGPSAARWAMQPAPQSKANCGAAGTGGGDVEWSEEELERQTRYLLVGSQLPDGCHTTTNIRVMDVVSSRDLIASDFMHAYRYFQELNDQRRAADEAAAAAASAASDPPPAPPTTPADTANVVPPSTGASSWTVEDDAGSSAAASETNAGGDAAGKTTLVQEGSAAPSPELAQQDASASVPLPPARKLPPPPPPRRPPAPVTEASGSEGGAGLGWAETSNVSEDALGGSAGGAGGGASADPVLAQADPLEARVQGLTATDSQGTRQAADVAAEGVAEGARRQTGEGALARSHSGDAPAPAAARTDAVTDGVADGVEHVGHGRAREAGLPGDGGMTMVEGAGAPDEGMPVADGGTCDRTNQGAVSGEERWVTFYDDDAGEQCS